MNGSFKLWELIRDFSDEERSNHSYHLRKWDNEHPIGELTQHPMMLPFILILAGCGALAGYEGLWNVPASYLLGWLISVLGSYIYFNNKLSSWKYNREAFEARLISEIIAGREKKH